MTSGLLTLLVGCLGYGIVSAFVPVFNAEAVVIASAAGGASAAGVGVAGVSVGQAIGKITIFVLVRKGVHTRLLPKRRRPQAPEEPPTGWRLRVRRWSDGLLSQLDRTWVGGLVVLASASAGIPPLAVVAVMAGLRRTQLWVFVVAVLAGRGARFAVLAWPVVAIAH